MTNTKILRKLIKQLILEEIKSLREEEQESNPVAKEFKVNDDYETYTKKFVGQPLSQKELESLHHFETKPIKVDRNEIRFEKTDEFKNSVTVVIKKMKDSGQFSFTAFSKHEQMNDENPEGEDMESPDEMNPMGDTGGSEEKEDIIITKSILFKDDIEGGKTLSDFLKKLEL